MDAIHSLPVGEDGWRRATSRQLDRLSGWSRATTQRGVDSLVQAGLLERRSTERAQAAYRITDAGLVRADQSGPESGPGTESSLSPSPVETKRERRGEEKEERTSSGPATDQGGLLAIAAALDRLADAVESLVSRERSGLSAAKWPESAAKEAIYPKPADDAPDVNGWTAHDVTGHPCPVDRQHAPMQPAWNSKEGTRYAWCGFPGCKGKHDPRKERRRQAAAEDMAQGQRRSIHGSRHSEASTMTDDLRAELRRQTEAREARAKAGLKQRHEAS
jgi:hypothetical protein